MTLQICAVLFVVLALAHGAIAGEWSDWKDGRATHYGTDVWSIHKGSCGYGYLDKHVSTGWDVVAISDKAWDYSGSCGKCKEVKCKNKGLKDGYGSWLDRHVCHNEYASVVVMVTDTCPCYYPNNYSSNKRWCCMDMYHLDMSVWAYEKLAEVKWGVIGVQWRDVPCWYKPSSAAKVPDWSKPTDEPWWDKAPSNWNKDWDKRTNNQFKYQNGRKH